jgi:sugar lactone lactonase YvrE
MSVKSAFVCLVLAGLAAGCTVTGGAGRTPSRIVVERGGFIPEGIEFDTTQRRFLTGSLVDGTVYEIASDGTLTPFVVDSDLVSSVGIEVDEPRDRLLVANSDRAVFDGQGPGVSKLGVYRLSTGARIAMVDLGAVAGGNDESIVFANDVTVDDAGNAYLTDTWMNVVYRVGTDYQPSVLYRFEPTTGLGLNGIVHHPDGFLIVVAVGGQGLLYRIPVDDPAGAEPIELSDPATGADGLLWAPGGELIVVSNSTSSVMAYTSDDGFRSAELAGTARFDGQATTGAAVDGDIYIVQPHFNDDEAPVLLRVRL